MEIQERIEISEKIEIFDRFEMIAGIIIAVFTAILAINGLSGSSYVQSALLANSEKVNAYDWYNTKGIKQILVEGQKDTLDSLLASGAVNSTNRQPIEDYSEELSKKIDKYIKEKNEILLGSDNISQEDWIQDVDGKLGQVVGAKDWEKEIAVNNLAGAKSDLAELFLQIGLVLGAISLVMQTRKTKWVFLYAMIVTGMVGSFFATWAILILWPF
jgi:hypothetical protein